MIIRKTATDRQVIINAVNAALVDSRFTADLYSTTHSRYGPCINIQQVRLRERKHFCGNHPNACAGFGGPHKRTRHLEGADWVEFNDLLNDVLDGLGVAASVFSRPLEIRGPLIVRKGLERRVAYNSELPWDSHQFVWIHDEPGVYRNCIGAKAPRSKFPFGSPGINTAINYSCVGHAEHQH